MKIYKYYFNIGSTFDENKFKIQEIKTRYGLKTYFVVNEVSYSLSHINNLDIPFFSLKKLTNQQINKLGEEIMKTIF